MLSVMLYAVLLAQEPASPAPIPTEDASSVRRSPRTMEGKEVKAPRRTKHVSPEWPTNAMRAGLTGSVVLECVVGVDGRIETVTLLKGYRSLAESASAAVRKWRYTPGELDGKPVPVIMTITVNFKLPRPPTRGDALEALRDSDPEIRWAAVRWVGRYRPVVAEQMRALESALQDPSELVRGAAKDALAKIEAP